MLMRPLSIDALLAEHDLHQWGQEVFVPRNHLVAYEKASILQFTPSQTAKAMEKLHSLSQILHLLREELTDLQERLQHLVGIHRRLMDLSGDRYDPVDAEAVGDSFEYIMSKTNTLKRWVVNYNERTGIRINLFFNLATQSDSRTNLEIARLSSNIAVSTQRDSSSMITMAAVTMFFLPGTFVSALFSMVFFDSKPNESGRESLVVGRQWWLFPVITVPLTILVFTIWVAWQRHRRRMEEQNLGINDSTEIVGAAPTLEKSPQQAHLDDPEHLH